MFKTHRFFYDAGTGADGGLPPAMGDVDDTTTLPSSMGNTEKTTNLADIASPLPEKPVDQASPAPSGDKPPEAPVDAPEGDKKPEEGADAPPEGGDEPEITPEAFFGEIEKLSGVKYEVTFPEGVDPLSPEGFVIRDKAVRDRALDDYEDYLKKTDPESYAYMIHRQSGGTREEFFTQNKSFTLPSAEALATDIDLQRTIYKHSLVVKGTDPEEAEVLVENAIQKGKLQERAIAAHTKLDGEAKADMQRIQNAAVERERKQQETESATRALLQQSISNLPNFIVPEAQQADFERFVWDKFQLSEDGKVLIVQELNPQEITKQMEGMLFQFMKGDMSGVVNKKARTIASQSLSKRNVGALKGPNAVAANGHGTKNYVPLTEVD